MTPLVHWLDSDTHFVWAVAVGYPLLYAAGAGLALLAIRIRGGAR